MNAEDQDVRVLNTKDEERALAFKKIEMAVRDSDIWKAAWYMGKFLKRSYTLTRGELKWLQEEHMDRIKGLQEAVAELQAMALNHAQEDFSDWLQHGLPFWVVEEVSYSKHFSNSNVAHLERKITTDCRAAAYLKGVIEMRNNLAGLSMVERTSQGIELEAMGACPGVEAYEKLQMEEVDWEFVEKNETLEPLTQWTVVRFGNRQESGVCEHA